jgi:hypothetical protein
MPIHLNLLAEAIAAEEQRRRDPVKRALWISGILIALLLLWSALLYTKALVKGSERSRLETDIASQERAYQQVTSSHKELERVQANLAALRQLATNRFLTGSLLQAVQQVTLSDVQLVRLRTEQTYVFTAETKAKTNDARRAAATKPAAKSATVTERFCLTLDAKDSSANPGDQVNRFKESLSTSPYFRDLLGKTNEVTLRSLSTPQVDPDTGKACVLFSLECRTPDKTR